VPPGYDGFLQWIEASDISGVIRRSTWLYPFIEILHIFGIVLVAGGAVFFDIQLLTALRKRGTLPSFLPFNLLTWSKRGLILAIPTGILLFATNAVALGYDPVFGAKLLLLLVAAINAWIFHVRVYIPYRHTAAEFNRTTAGVNAMASIIVWMSVISCGRLLAY